MRRSAVCASLICLLFCMPGCQVDEKKEVDLYRKVLDGRHAPTVEYNVGEPLSLPQALLLANQHSERLTIQGEDYVQALIDKERAIANFLPTISLVPSWSVADGSNDAGSRRIQGGVGTVDPNQLLGSNTATGNNNFDTPANLNANLFRGFRDVATLQRSKDSIKRNRALLLDLQATVLLDVAQTYYQVLRQEAAVKVLENSALVQNDRVQEMRTRDVVGSASKLDVAQTEAQAAATRASLIAARSDARNARAVLAFVINAPVADAALVDKLDLPEITESVEVFTALAERQRQDLRAAEDNIEAARQNVQVAYGQYYPSVSLNINYYLSRQSLPSDSEWNTLVSASIPIFEAGRIHADYRTALSQLRQAKAQESLLRRQIIQDTFVAYQNVDTSANRLKELNIEVNAAQQALDVATARYHNGGGTYLDQLVAQDRLLSAQLDLANEQFNRKLQYLNLLRTIGELYRPPSPMEVAPETTRPVSSPSSAPSAGSLVSDSGPPAIDEKGLVPASGPATAPAEMADPSTQPSASPAQPPK